MKTKIIILLTACLLFSCKTTKTATKTDVKAHETVALDVRETASAIDVKTATLNVDSKVNINEDMIETGTRTKWSAPDAAGKQFPTETENYTKGKKSNTKAETTAKAQEDKTVENRLSRTDKSDYKSEKNEKIKENKKTELKAPTGVSWGIVILTAGLLVLLFLILKSYKVF